MWNWSWRFELAAWEINKSWSIFTPVKEHWSQFHRLSQFFNINSGLRLYILMLPLCRSDCSISTWAPTPPFDSFYSICFNQRISIDLIQRHSERALVCSFSIFIVWHTSILIIHLFYDWRGAERTEASASATMRNGIDHQFIFMFYNTSIQYITP